MLAGEVGPTEIQREPTGPAPAGALFRGLASGGLMLVGVFLALAGLAVIPGVHVVYGSATGWGSVGLGCALVVLGVFNYVWIGQVFARRANRITVSSRGLELQRIDGVIVRAAWKDAGLRVDISNPTPNDTSGPVWLNCVTPAGEAFGPITRSGSTLVEAEAARNGLRIETSTMGRPPRTTVRVEIRPR